MLLADQENEAKYFESGNATLYQYYSGRVRAIQMALEILNKKKFVLENLQREAEKQEMQFRSVNDVANTYYYSGKSFGLALAIKELENL